jgi:hypothetical protein
MPLAVRHSSIGKNLTTVSTILFLLNYDPLSKHENISNYDGFEKYYYLDYFQEDGTERRNGKERGLDTLMGM